VIFKSDKLDYLRCPRKEIFFDNLFSIEQGPSNVGKLNWDLLGFFFIHIQSHLGCWIRSIFQGMYWCAHNTATLTSIQHTVIGGEGGPKIPKI
jgi:hypothetical protein